MFGHYLLFRGASQTRQAVAELGQAQVKLEV